MKSMTGYGKNVVELDGRSLQIELKAVNHRFLDLNIKLPRAHNFAETIIRKGIQEKVNRGHIDVFVCYSDNREIKSELTVNEALANQYVSVANELAKKFNIINDYNVCNLMRTPDVISENAIADDEELIFKMYNDCISVSVDNLNQMRMQEGSSIKNEFTVRINNLKISLASVIERAPEVFNEFKAKLKDKIEQSLQDVAIDEARLLNEVAFYSEKGAIDEEISRLEVHLNNFLELMSDNEANGRKLDFLVQEMNRETNTIGSKANDIIIVNQVLVMKAEIEKIREQIQNVE